MRKNIEIMFIVCAHNYQYYPPSESVDECFQRHTLWPVHEKKQIIFHVYQRERKKQLLVAHLKVKLSLYIFAYRWNCIWWNPHLCKGISQNAHVASLKIVINFFFPYAFVCWTWQNVIIQLCNLITVWVFFDCWSFPFLRAKEKQQQQQQ